MSISRSISTSVIQVTVIVPERWAGDVSTRMRLAAMRAVSGGDALAYIFTVNGKQVSSKGKEIPDANNQAIH